MGVRSLGYPLRVRSLLTTLVFLLPIGRQRKPRMLNRLGHDIHPTAWIGTCFVRHIKRFEMAEGSVIGSFNIFRDMDLVSMGRGAIISYRNFIMAGQTLEPGQAEGGRVLRMGAHSHITSWHHIDCSGGVILGEDAWITGMRSTVMSHAFDPHNGGMIHEPIEIKRGAVVATNCTLLTGAVVGEGALIAAGSAMWTRQEASGQHVHGGVPARRLGPITISPWVYEYNRYTG